MILHAEGSLWTEWSFPPVPAVGIVLTLVVYLRGWMRAHRTRPLLLPRWRMGMFVLGMLVLWIAIASPIDELDEYLLCGHMIQHFLLMSAVPPLLLLGYPTVPLLRGLPQSVVKGLAPLFRSRGLHAFFRFLVHPVTAWLAMNIAYLLWHVPVMFELTFRSERWHDFEHLCFVGTSLLFWWVVIQPWPARAWWPRWTVIPFLLSGDVVNTMLSAALTFSGRVFYPSYAAAERITRLSPLQDQIAAGGEMWVLNSIVFLIPAAVITMRLLAPRHLRPTSANPLVAHIQP